MIVFSLPQTNLNNSWRGGRVVEGDGLENHYTRKGIAGSNPVLSAFNLLTSKYMYGEVPEWLIGVAC
jgi:hypothetical protein